jgi:hypothetical protein
LIRRKTVNKYEFVDYVQKLRRISDTEPFKENIIENEIFLAIVDKVEALTKKWGDTSGLNSKKKADEDSLETMSEKEIQWSKYFKNHSFSSLEEMRNIVDAFSIVEGMDLNKFICVSKNKARFPAYICIVPTCASHTGHDYRIGRPIFSFGAGAQFYKENGAAGNSMTTNIAEYRLGTRAEIISLLSSIMFRMGSAAEALVVGMLDERNE